MINRLQGWLVMSHWVRAHWRARWLHGSRLRAFQEHRARRAVIHAIENAPFFRTHWAGHDLRRWDTLPVVDKQTMMAHFDTYNTLNIHCDEAMTVALKAEQSRDFQPVLNGVAVGLSSGTSGHRGLFALSTAEQAAWAGTILARTVHSMLPRRLRVAFFLRSNSNLYEHTNSAFVRFRYFDLMTPLDEINEALNDFRPSIVVGPPSLLQMLANAKQDGTLQIAPARLISVAEVLEPQEQKLIERAFAASVHQVYQCTEGLLAVSCAAGSLHVQEDIVRIQWELLDDHEHEDIQRYTPLVTDLWRSIQPIIRYRLDDVVQLDPTPCTCGSDWQVIRIIEGRRDDVCWFERDEGGLRPFFSDTLRRTLLLASGAILDYEIIQQRDGALSVQLMVAPAADVVTVIEAVRMSIETTIKDYGCQIPELEINTLLTLPPLGTKRRRVQHRTIPA